MNDNFFCHGLIGSQFLFMLIHSNCDYWLLFLTNHSTSKLCSCQRVCHTEHISGCVHGGMEGYGSLSGDSERQRESGRCFWDCSGGWTENGNESAEMGRLAGMIVGLRMGVEKGLLLHYRIGWLCGEESTGRGKQSEPNFCWHETKFFLQRGLKTCL